ncbi:MAG: flavin reductase family protein [Actinomycetota bacterium]
MSVGPEAFRASLRKFASGITIVTVALGDALYGMTCTSFASVSLDPPLVLVCLENDSHTLNAVTQARSFAVSVLGEAHEDLARAFSTPGTKPFHLLGGRAEDGAPMADEPPAWLECSVEKIFEAGDHHVVLGLVEACGTNGNKPLLYFDRRYHRLR